LVLEIFRTIKPEIRVLGIDDAPHIPRTKTYVPVVGAVFRGGFWLDGVMSTRVLVDGFDSTRALSDMITGSPHFKQLRVVMINGITLGGFNIVDISTLNKTTGLPVIAVSRKNPNMTKVYQAIKKLSQPEERLKLLDTAGEIVTISLKNRRGQLFIQTSGIALDDAQKILDLTATRSITPEPLRVAHLIASGVGMCGFQF
jgi:endonuclease V-like protein UPF0215 family